jgi:uncharacterized protein
MSTRQISEIWVYPIKSLGGISMTTAQVLPKGLAYDRRWMLVDASNQFMTQRLVPAMALFRLEIEHDALRVSYQGDAIEFPVEHQHGASFSATIWDDTVMVNEVHEEWSSWFSDKLGMSCKLVSFPEDNARSVDPNFKIGDDHVSLADAYPVLVIGQRSLDDLNTRLSEPVPMNRFRPNLVFTGGEPYEEDGWKNFKVGKNRFAGVKPCARCAVPTVNQATGEKGTEPLATLSKYRKIGNKVLFGQNLIALNYDEVRVGDEIILE